MVMSTLSTSMCTGNSCLSRCLDTEVSYVCCPPNRPAQWMLYTIWSSTQYAALFFAGNTYDLIKWIYCSNCVKFVPLCSCASDLFFGTEILPFLVLDAINCLLKFRFLSSFTFPSILLRKKSVYIGCKSKIQLTKWCLTVVVVVVVFFYLRGGFTSRFLNKRY